MTDKDRDIEVVAGRFVANVLNCKPIQTADYDPFDFLLVKGDTQPKTKYLLEVQSRNMTISGSFDEIFVNVGKVEKMLEISNAWGGVEPMYVMLFECGVICSVPPDRIIESRVEAGKHMVKREHFKPIGFIDV